MCVKLGRLTAVFVLAAFLITGVGQAQDSATLDPIQGLVQRRGMVSEDWETIVQRILVDVGDWVQTDGAGLAELTFFDGVLSQILPNSLIQVAERTAADNGQFQVTLDLLAGQTFNRVDRVLDAESRYSIRTPGALMTVRGTAFWVNVAPDGITTVIVEEGTVEVSDLGGGVSSSVGAGESVTVSPEGKFGPVRHNATPPDFPPEAELVSASCGDLRCGIGERCAADCDLPPHCGDEVCQPDEGESPLTCAKDCVYSGERTSYLHFYWGGMTCEFTPAPPVTSPIVFTWGIGCFDTAESASEHPHPADYQLIIDGQAWDMGGLQQNGPNRHDPDCPWGWNYSIGPIVLEPGPHTMSLIENCVDTWYAESGGHTAGTSAQLDCAALVIR
jgi:hypothetical protein